MHSLNSRRRRRHTRHAWAICRKNVIFGTLIYLGTWNPNLFASKNRFIIVPSLQNIKFIGHRLRRSIRSTVVIPRPPPLLRRARARSPAWPARLLLYSTILHKIHNNTQYYTQYYTNYAIIYNITQNYYYYYYYYTIILLLLYYYYTIIILLLLYYYYGGRKLAQARPQAGRPGRPTWQAKAQA